ncbi:MAG: AAA family ATPase [Gemmatimonadota bacterium]|nr:AAA family ATPase [Gemmatimonadota bacterium]
MASADKLNIVKSKMKPATFRFSNIGPVKDAKLELGELTIIAGRNNTGKTYMAYTLYAFLKMYEEWPELIVDAESVAGTAHAIKEMLAIRMRKILQAEQPVDWTMRNEMRSSLMDDMTRTFSDTRLSRVFSSPTGVFDGARLDVELARDPSNGKRIYETIRSDGAILSLNYDGEKASLYIEEGKQPYLRSDIDEALSHLYLRFLFPEIPSETFILSSERFGISLFYRELDFTKNQLVDLLQKMGDDKAWGRSSRFMFIDGATSRYALPIKHNIDYTRSIPDLRAKESELHAHKLHDGIKDMMGGYYRASEEEIRFISKARGKGRSFNIPLHNASSSARGLSDFYFFLRHVASSGHLLIIDEPESHLDTANQILLARLLARFVRAGLKVLITTHSDYLIKEINNLVMLNSTFAEKESVVKKLKYRPDDALEPESIRAYIAEDNGLKKCDVDEFGIDMPVFDGTIDEINAVANELTSRISEDSEAAE